MSRPREYCTFSFSDTDIENGVLAQGITTWISSMVEGLLKDAKFDHSDFIGNEKSAVSVDDIAVSMLFYAFKIGSAGGDLQWEDECYQDFKKQEKMFDRLLKKIEALSSKNGAKKITMIRKEIRSRVESKESLTRAPLDPLGVFVDASDMGEVYSLSTPGELVRSLHLLGGRSEDDPRYYIHTIFRYHLNELHSFLSEDKKVMRFPSIQKWMDIFTPVDSFTNLPPEFRAFMKQIAGGSSVPVVSLPVPSKTRPKTVVYGYDFENTPWVPVLRQKIFGIFSEWKTSSSKAYLEIYPGPLILGDPRNRIIKDSIAKSMEMRSLKESHDSLVGIDLGVFFKIVSVLPDAANIYPNYKKETFDTPGEQLRERRGFFMQKRVRGVFKSIAKQFPDFCSDVYSTLKISVGTIEEFYEYCGIGSNPLKRFSVEDQKLWRDFLSALEKISLVFHVCSRVEELESFFATHGSPDAFVKEMLLRSA